jgi:hypothetical protein
MCGRERKNEEGGRRYEAWEVVEKVLARLGEDREDIVSAIGFEGLLGSAIPPGAMKSRHKARF